MNFKEHKNLILAIAAGLAVVALLFAWLFLVAEMPKPADKGKLSDGVRATIHHTVLERKEKGKLLWRLQVGEAAQVDETRIQAKDLEGTVYLEDGDELHVQAKGGNIQLKNNDFSLDEGVRARLKSGGFLKAQKVEWKQKGDILTAEGDIRVVKDDMLATGGKLETTSKLEHFKLSEKAHVERGGHYAEE